MNLLIIRHAIAETREEFAARGGHDDDDRPLTPTGRRRMRENVRGLHRAAPRISVLAASPLVRAQQTARLVVNEYRLAEVETVKALRPERHPRDLLTWLRRQPSEATVAVVGHDPHLARLATWCTAAGAEPMITLKKGGAALVQFDRRPAAGSGRLLWLLTPAQLRALAESAA